MISFVLGILSGGSLLYFFSKNYWQQRLRAERNEFFSQLDVRLNSEISRKNKLEEERQNLLKKFDLEKQDNLLLQKQYEQFEQKTNDNIGDYRAQINNLKKGNQNLRDEKTQLLIRNDRLTHYNEQLLLENEQLTKGNEQLTLENEELILRCEELVLEKNGSSEFSMLTDRDIMHEDQS